MQLPGIAAPQKTKSPKPTPTPEPPTPKWIGETTTETVNLVTAVVRWDKSESNVARYSPPTKDMVILSYQALERKKIGSADYTFQLVPADSHFATETRINEVFNDLKDFAASVKNYSASAKLDEQKNMLIEMAHKADSSHSTLVCHWHVSGSGKFFDQGRGFLTLDAKVKLMHVITPSALDTIASQLRDEIKKGAPTSSPTPSPATTLSETPTPTPTAIETPTSTP